MCGSTVEIQSATAEIRRGKKVERQKDRKKKKPQGKNIDPNGLPITHGGHNKPKSKENLNQQSTLRTVHMCVRMYNCHIRPYSGLLCARYNCKYCIVLYIGP